MTNISTSHYQLHQHYSKEQQQHVRRMLEHTTKQHRDHTNQIEQLYTQHHQRLLQGQQAQLHDWQRGFINGFDKVANHASDIASHIEQSITGSFKTLEDILVDFTFSGELHFKKLADYILQQFARVQIKHNIIAPLAGQANQLSRAILSPSSLQAGLYHDGGKVSIMPKKTRIIPPQALVNLPHYHQGGTIKNNGLANNEQLAVLQHGEHVFTAKQLQQLHGYVNLLQQQQTGAVTSNNSSNYGRHAAVNITINNQGGGVLDIVKQHQTNDGDGTLNIELLTRIIKADIYNETANGEGVASILNKNYIRR